MAVNLEKGQRISLEKEAGKLLTKIVMGLGWDAAKKGFFSSGGGSIDLDASCVMFGPNKEHKDTVWFRQLKSKDGSIVHTGDNLTGEGEGDDEQIIVQLDKVPADVATLVFTVNSFRGQTFKNVANAYCRIVDNSTQTEIARYNLSGGHNNTGMIMAKVYRHGGEWKMHALGEPASGRTFNDLMPAIQNFL
ncbi:MAG: TerD family protein [Synergistaceae bacterium]|jgi:tellurium resistance protein TerZ|nr:TerD family protein [Synergistaceae bacterium]